MMSFKSKNKIKRFTVSMSEDLLTELIEITNERKKSRMINKVCMEFLKMKLKENLISIVSSISCLGKSFLLIFSNIGFVL